jgi:hypothetical protein
MSLPGSQHRMKMAAWNRKADYTGRAIYGRGFETPTPHSLSDTTQVVSESSLPVPFFPAQIGWVKSSQNRRRKSAGDRISIFPNGFRLSKSRSPVMIICPRPSTAQARTRSSSGSRDALNICAGLTI